MAIFVRIRFKNEFSFKNDDWWNWWISKKDPGKIDRSPLIAIINRLISIDKSICTEAFRKHSSAFLSKERAHHWNVLVEHRLLSTATRAVWRRWGRGKKKIELSTSKIHWRVDPLSPANELFASQKLPLYPGLAVISGSPWCALVLPRWTLITHK